MTFDGFYLKYFLELIHMLVSGPNNAARTRAITFPRSWSSKALIRASLTFGATREQEMESTINLLLYLTPRDKPSLK